MVDNLLQSTANQVGADALPDYVKRQLGGRWAGSIAGNGSEELQQKPGTLDWVRLLRRYVGQAFEVRADYRRPARRFVDRVGIVPGKRRASLRPRVMAVLDTSGSMTPESLATISGELSRMAACYRVTVVECDCAIQKVYEFRPITQVSGRGGTSFLPPLETSFLRTHKPDLIVFFTDGFGDAPDRQPRAHVIWCLVPGGQRPAPWGRVISMNT
jgi:predicted metal-dependent peptidase